MRPYASDRIRGRVEAVALPQEVVGGDGIAVAVLTVETEPLLVQLLKARGASLKVVGKSALDLRQFCASL